MQSNGGQDGGKLWMGLSWEGGRPKTRWRRAGGRKGEGERGGREIGGRGGKGRENGGKFENEKFCSSLPPRQPVRQHVLDPRLAAVAWSKSTRQGSNPRHGDLQFPLIPPLYH